jgi:putative ABC transport system permease protein
MIFLMDELSNDMQRQTSARLVFFSVSSTFEDFIRLAAFALIIAFPIAGWLMNKWLQSFNYRISLAWWMYAIAGLTAVLIALVTVSYQSIKAA